MAINPESLKLIYIRKKRLILFGTAFAVIVVIAPLLYYLERSYVFENTIRIMEKEVRFSLLTALRNT